MFHELKNQNRFAVVAGSVLVAFVALIAALPIAGLFTYVIRVGFPSSPCVPSAGVMFVLCYLVTPAVLIALPVFGASLGRLVLSAVPGTRPLDDAERSLLLSVEQISIAAGLSTPDVLVVESRLINVATVGVGSRQCLIFTSASLSLSGQQREAFVAMAVARGALTSGAMGILLMVMSLPGLLRIRSARMFDGAEGKVAQSVAWIGTAMFVGAIVLLLGTMKGQSDVLGEGGTVLAVLLLIALLAVTTGALLMQMWTASTITSAEKITDAAAVELLRYPPHFENSSAPCSTRCTRHSRGGATRRRIATSPFGQFRATCRAGVANV